MRQYNAKTGGHAAAPGLAPPRHAQDNVRLCAHAVVRMASYCKNITDTASAHIFVLLHLCALVVSATRRIAARGASTRRVETAARRVRLCQARAVADAIVLTRLHAELDALRGEGRKVEKLAARGVAVQLAGAPDGGVERAGSGADGAGRRGGAWRVRVSAGIPGALRWCADDAITG